MNNEKIISRIRKTCTAGIAAIFVFVAISIRGIVSQAVQGFTEGWNAADSEVIGYKTVSGLRIVSGGLTGIALIFIGIYLLINCLRMLVWFRKSESPFDLKFSRELKDIGVGFMLLEPVGAIFSVVALGEYPDAFGLYFSAGVLILCISMIFRYGTELQRESDETL